MGTGPGGTTLRVLNLNTWLVNDPGVTNPTLEERVKVVKEFMRIMCEKGGIDVYVLQEVWTPLHFEGFLAVIVEALVLPLVTVSNGDSVRKWREDTKKGGAELRRYLYEDLGFNSVTKPYPATWRGIDKMMDSGLLIAAPEMSIVDIDFEGFIDLVSDDAIAAKGVLVGTVQIPAATELCSGAELCTIKPAANVVVATTHAQADNELMALKNIAQGGTFLRHIVSSIPKSAAPAGVILTGDFNVNALEVTKDGVTVKAAPNYAAVLAELRKGEVALTDAFVAASGRKVVPVYDASGPMSELTLTNAGVTHYNHGPDKVEGGTASPYPPEDQVFRLDFMFFGGRETSAFKVRSAAPLLSKMDPLLDILGQKTLSAADASLSSDRGRHEMYFPKDESWIAAGFVSDHAPLFAEFDY